MNIEKMKSKTKIIGDKKFIVKYGFHYIRGNKRPYFSITVDIYEKQKNGHWEDVGGGAAHDIIREQFPELAHLIKWHLVDDNGTPMHYVENAIYWLEFVHNVSQWELPSTDPLNAFKSTVVFGAVESDKDDSLIAPLIVPDELQEDLNPALALKNRRLQLQLRVQEWCKARFPALQQKMKDEMIGDNIPFIDESEYKGGK